MPRGSAEKIVVVYILSQGLSFFHEVYFLMGVRGEFILSIRPFDRIRSYMCPFSVTDCTPAQYHSQA